MDTDTLMFIENIQINFDYTKWIHYPVNRLNWILIIAPRRLTLFIIRQQNADTTQPNVSPDIACRNIRFSLFAAEDVSRGDLPSGRRARRNGDCP